MRCEPVSEWIVDNRGGVCEQCEQQYQSLSQHWARNSRCSHRTVPETLDDVIRGCLLGDGSLDNPNDGPPALRISSMREAHIEWVHDQLGWLSRGVTNDSRGAYRLRTMSHPHLGAFWTWQGTPPAEGWTLSRPIARIWYACDGSLEWPGQSDRPRVQWTISDEAKRTAVLRVLREEDYEPMEWERRVALPIEATDQWLEWVGPPTPGSEYKWATDRSEYEARREDVQA